MMCVRVFPCTGLHMNPRQHRLQQMLMHFQHTWHFWWCFSRSLLLRQCGCVHVGWLHCSMCVQRSLPSQPN
jgi:hypothetical protein